MEAKFREVNLRKTEEELIDRIAKSRFQEENRHVIKQMMRHDCWTQKQFADLTGKSVATINNLAKRGRKKNNEWVKALNTCNPWPNFSDTNIVFIVRDQLSMEILLKSLK
jgi:hypothetical protein